MTTPDHDPWLPGTLLVKFYAWDDARVRELLVEHGGEEINLALKPIRWAKCKVPHDRSPADMIQALLMHPEVEDAQYDGTVRPGIMSGLHPNDPFIGPRGDGFLNLPTLWRIDVFRAHRHTRGDPSIMVAVIDSGWYPHEDLPSPSIEWNTLAIDFAYHTASARGGNGSLLHGEVVSGVIFATPDNAKGCMGVAPGCGFAAVRCGPDNIYDAIQVSDMVDAFTWCATHPSIKVVNASLGRSGPASQIEIDAVALFPANGKIFTSSAGNTDTYCGVPNFPSPGGCEGAICVGACATDDPSAGAQIHNLDVRSYYVYQASNYGPQIDIVAPDSYPKLSATGGVSTYGLINNTAADAWQGTSFASPSVAAVCGLIWSANPNLTRQQVLDILFATTVESVYPNGNAAPGRDPVRVGMRGVYPWRNDFPNARILNAARAVLKALTTVAANAGVIYPYLQCMGDVNVANSVVYGTAGSVPRTTTLNGRIFIDVDGYSSDPIIDVELAIEDGAGGWTVVYSGEPTRVRGVATYTGTQHKLRVTATTELGSTSEIYDDILVTTLVTGIGVTATLLPDGTVHLSGYRTRGAPVTVT
jgi:hypothetical protein